MRVPLSLDLREIKDFPRLKPRWQNSKNKIWLYSLISNSNSEIYPGPRTHIDIQFSIYLHFIVNNHDKRATFIDFSEIIYYYFITSNLFIMTWCKSHGEHRELYQNVQLLFVYVALGYPVKWIHTWTVTSPGGYPGNIPRPSLQPLSMCIAK